MLNEIYQNLDPIAFAIGPVTVRWYGIAYILGFACAALVIWRLAKRWRVRVDEDALLTIMVCVIVGIILGGRLGYVLFYGDGYYFSHPWEIFALNHGGMSFHGGLIGALLAGIAAAKFTGIPYLTLADMGCVAAPLGLLFGRLANFVNGELWGAPTDLPWGVVFGGLAGDMPRHPSQLYEALLEGVVIFCVLFALSRKRPPRPRGTFLGIFLIMYGAFRFLVEFRARARRAIGIPVGRLAHYGPSALGAAHCGRHRAAHLGSEDAASPGWAAGDSAAVCSWRGGLGAPSGFLVTTWCHPALRKLGRRSFQYNISRLRTARLRLFVTSSYKRYEVEHGREILQVHALRQHCR